jgi:peptidyl-Lys metalloendopeptidase
MLGRLLLAVALVFASISSFARNNDLVVNLQLSDRSAVATQDVMLDVTFTNNGATSISLMRWFVPDGELEGDLFLLSRDGQAVPYVGPVIKRGPPTSQDMITLAPGESISGSVEISGLYDLSSSGVYSIRYGVASTQLFGRTSTRASSNLLRGELEQNLGEPQELISNEITTFVEGRKNPIIEQGNLMRAGESLSSTLAAVSFSGRCSATQQSTLQSAHSAAKTMANGSVTYLNGTPGSKPRYTTWFGAYSSAGWNEVKGHFVNIKDALDNKSIVYDCSCKKSYYAYVYPTQPYKVYLCRAFWTAPLTGTDSKGGTIIHELSHFNVVAGTDDLAYGQTAAKQLALSNPAQARMNADSHEYFAENTPAQQ